MSDTVITTPEVAEVQVDAGAAPANIYGMDVNYATSNAWFAALPLENILGKKYSDLNLHLTRFSLPQMQMSSQQISYRGYTKTIPAKVLNPDTKTLSLEYIVDEKWHNYRAIYAWMSCIMGNINKVTDDDADGIQPSEYIPLHIYLLDNYKRKIIQFCFENCWIETFNDIALEQNNTGEISHGFTFNYDRFIIEDV